MAFYNAIDVRSTQRAILPGKSYSQTPIPKIDDYCIQFIGGPFNAEQRYLAVKSHPNIRDGIQYTFIVKETPLSLTPQGDLIEATTLSVTYSLVFIPLNQTPFSDAQIVVGIFQP